MFQPSRARGNTALVASATLALGIGIGANLRPADAASTQRATPAPTHYSRYQKLDMFARALTIIEQHYVRPVDDQELVYASIRGLVGELDPHTSFLPPQEAKLLREDIEGAFGGVGMVVVLGRDPDGTRFLDVRDVVPDGPADEAGVEPGHRVVRIDGQPIAHFPDLQHAITTIRGKPGTTIKVTIEDPSRDIVRTITLTRQVIDPPAVEVTYLGEGVGVLRLRDFPEKATREVREGLASLERLAGKSKLRGVVLDLRDNGGGLLDEAIGIADVFISDGVIVRTRARRGVVVDEARARRTGTKPGVPLVVLVNKGSASASEIVAGALQDHGRAVVIGERTYGKGSVQAPFELGDGSLLKLTVALYYTPDDRLIQAAGIVPDVFVGAGTPGESAVRRDSRPEIRPERAHPRHLKPEDFGRMAADLADESMAVRTAGDDLQLRAAVQHLEAWSRIDAGASRE
jgi:carboxyl-terminal processing protease